MKVDNIKPQKIVIVSPVGHGVIVQERRLPMELDEKLANHLLHSGRRPPSLLRNNQFLFVSRFKTLSKVNNIVIEL